jgi:hypothetical protein
MVQQLTTGKSCWSDDYSLGDSSERGTRSRGLRLEIDGCSCGPGGNGEREEAEGDHGKLYAHARLL